jgi:integrase
VNKMPEIKQRGNSFCYVQEKGKDENGKRIRVTRGGFTTRKAATEDYKEQIRINTPDIRIGTSGEMFDDTAKNWLAYKVLEVRPATVRNITNVITKHIIPFFTKMPTANIGINEIRAFYIHLSGKGLANTTIKNIRMSLSECLSDAVNRGVINRNPTKLTKAPKSGNVKKFDYWNKEEINQFLTYAQGSKWYIGLLIAIVSGARQGELLALTWKNVNFPNNTITFDQSFAKAEVGYAIANTKTKSSERTIGMPKRIMDEIARYKDIIDPTSQKVFNGRNDYVIRTSIGTPVQPSNFYKEFIRVVEQSGVRRIKFHSLRHTAATLWIEESVSVNEVSRRLGHSSIVTTMEIYAHITPRMDEAFNQVVDGLINYLDKPVTVYPANINRLN